MFSRIRNIIPNLRRKAEKRGFSFNLHAGAFASFFNTESTISADKAIGISGVWRAISILAETIASLPLELYQEEENGDTNRAKKHPLYYLLHHAPSHLYSSFNFRESLILNLAMYGNAYAIIRRDEDARPTELILVESHEVSQFFDRPTRKVYYKVQGYGEIISSEDMIHVAGMGANAITGINKLATHGKTLNGAASIRDYAVNFFANGANPSGVLEHDSILNDSAYERLRTSWQSQYGGVANAGKTPILESGVKYKKIGTTPAEAGLIDNQKHYLEEISRIFGIPLHLLANLDRATFNNIEHLTLQFVKLTVTQLCTRIEEELQRKLLTQHEVIQQGYTVSFNLEGLLRGDTKNRAEYYRSMFSIGAMSVNEIRQKENMNRVEGGDTHYRPLNMEDITKIIEDDKKKGEEEDEAGESKPDIGKPAAAK